MAAFLGSRLPFLAIVDTVAAVLEEYLSGSPGNPRTVEDVLVAEGWARTRARELTGGVA